MKLSSLLAGIDRQIQQMSEWHVAVLVALVGLLGLSMPWVWADDHDSPYRAYGLMVHWITATDKWYLARTALVDSVVATAGAGGIITCTMYSAAKIFLTRRVNFDTTLRGVFVLVMCAAILFLCNNLLDPDRTQMGPAAMPGIGLVMVALSSALLCVMGVRGAYKEARVREQVEQMVLGNQSQQNEPPPMADPSPTAMPGVTSVTNREPQVTPDHVEPGSARGYGPGRWFEPEPETEPVATGDTPNPRPDPDSVYLPRHGGRRRTKLRDRNNRTY